MVIFLLTSNRCYTAGHLLRSATQIAMPPTGRSKPGVIRLRGPYGVAQSNNGGDGRGRAVGNGHSKETSCSLAYYRHKV